MRDSPYGPLWGWGHGEGSSSYSEWKLAAWAGIFIVEIHRSASETVLCDPEAQRTSLLSAPQGLGPAPCSPTNSDPDSGTKLMRMAMSNNSNNKSLALASTLCWTLGWTLNMHFLISPFKQEIIVLILAARKPAQGTQQVGGRVRVQIQSAVMILYTQGHRVTPPVSVSKSLPCSKTVSPSVRLGVIFFKVENLIHARDKNKV